MECHECGRRVERGDRFCTGCGTPLQGVSDTTQVASGVDDGPEPPDGVADEAPATADDATTGLVERIDEPVIDPVIESTNGDSQTGTTNPASTASSTTPVRAAGDAGEHRAPAEPGAADPAELRTELIEVVEPDGSGDWSDEPDWAATGTVPIRRDIVATGDLPETEPITEVRMSPVQVEEASPATTPYDFAESEPVAVTGEVPLTTPATAQMPTVAAYQPPPPGTRFGFGLITFIAIVTGIVSMIALFANVVAITSDVRLTPGPDSPAGFRTGNWALGDLADNLPIAGLVTVLLMVVGGVASGFRWRWGSGLAGGAGLAMAGISAVTLGLAQMPVDLAHLYAAIPPEVPFVLTITRDLGYWLHVAAGALGIVLFFATFNEAFGDRRSGLNPWIAAVGALATVVTVAGPLLPEDQAIFSDNWYLIEGAGQAPALLLVGRLVQLGLLLIGGVTGFLSVRRWGLGVAAGVSLPIVWLAVSTVFELTDRPVGPGFRNPGATDMHVHGVTIIGVSAVLAMVLLGIIAAYDQGVREHP